MILLTIPCKQCNNSITVKDLKMTSSGIGYKLDRVLKQHNFYKFENGFLCSACHDKQIKVSA